MLPIPGVGKKQSVRSDGEQTGPVALNHVIDLLRPHFQGQQREQLRALFFGPGGHALVGMAAWQGSKAAVELSVRRIVASALAADACAMVLAHNHPSGDPNPSVQDVHATRDLARLCFSLDIRLLDHIVMSGEQITSMRAMRLI